MFKCDSCLSEITKGKHILSLWYHTLVDGRFAQRYDIRCYCAVMNVNCDWPCALLFSVYLCCTLIEQNLCFPLSFLNLHYLEMHIFAILQSFSCFHLFCCPVLHWSVRFLFSPLPPLPFAVSMLNSADQRFRDGRSSHKSLCREVANLFSLGQRKTAKQRRIHAVLNNYPIVEYSK